MFRHTQEIWWIGLAGVAREQRRGAVVSEAPLPLVPRQHTESAERKSPKRERERERS